MEQDFSGVDKQAQVIFVNKNEHEQQQRVNLSTVHKEFSMNQVL